MLRSCIFSPTGYGLIAQRAYTMAAQGKAISAALGKQPRATPIALKGPNRRFRYIRPIPTSFAPSGQSRVGGHRTQGGATPWSGLSGWLGACPKTHPSGAIAGKPNAVTHLETVSTMQESLSAVVTYDRSHLPGATLGTQTNVFVDRNPSRRRGKPLTRIIKNPVQILQSPTIRDWKKFIFSTEIAR